MPQLLRRREAGTGALLGGLLMAPALAILYAGHTLAGLPFAPFDVFDRMARVLPGPLITFGIDTMVAAIRALGIGDLSRAAKTAEQLLALAAPVVAGAVIGAILFALTGPRHDPDARPDDTGGRRPLRRRPVPAALLAGGIVGAVAILAGPIAAAGRGGIGAGVAGALWTLLVFLAWGGVLGWSQRRLYGHRSLPADADATAAGAGGESPASVERIDRRRFVIRLGGSAAVITVAGAWVGELGGRSATAGGGEGTAWSATHRLPNADAPVTPVPGTRAELTPVADHYRIDINTGPPVVREDEWRLRIRGRVGRPRAWTLAELRAFEPLHQFITLACISNPIGGSLTGTQRWTGVPLRRILDDARPREDGRHLVIRSVDGFHETLPAEAAMGDERIMLTYAWDGLPLPTRHGFPLRVYIPDRYGMKQPKWIREIEVVDAPEDGYWVRRGWDREARMHATSVIDTVGVDMMVASADASTIVPIGGIAHAGARGISRVEVRVDDGPWQAARLRDPLSDRTWVIWRFGWAFREGEHTFTVRCVDGEGRPQVEERTPVRPDGATGLHRRSVMV